MIVIYCNDPLNNSEVDIDYLNEFETASTLGFEVGLISYEELVRLDNPTRAINRVKASDQIQTAIYRGWMLKPGEYEKLYSALLQKNIKLINSVEEYIHCHYLPSSYHIIKDKTPISIWISVTDFNNNFELIRDKLSIFNDQPIMVKDYVKSRKHEWNDACFISNASDEKEVRRVTGNFINLQGDDLNEGLVYREFIELEFLKNHSKSQMPLTKEYRIFILNKKPILILKYWDEGEYTNENLFFDEYKDVFEQIESNFFTIDVAKRKNGEWIIIEVGDGQVSGLPDNANIEEFYNRILLGSKPNVI